MSSVTFIPATEADYETLAGFAAKTFTATFGHLYTPENLQRHLSDYCCPGYFREAVEAGEDVVLVKDGDTLIGYGKAGRVVLPIDSPIPEDAIEIHRVYIDAPYQGRGLGRQLMDHLLALPKLAAAPMIYLGVWEENLAAQALYASYGFTQVGRYLYQVGSQFDREIILARKRW
jgi:ribosomal protein S18 acetylase RimI-like enzyme